MAEALAVIGIVSNIAQLTDFSIFLFSRVKLFLSKSAALPPALHSLSLTLPLLQSVTETVQRRVQDDDFGRDAEIAIRGVLMGLSSEIEGLNALLSSILPDENASKWERGMKAVKSIRVGRDIEERNGRIQAMIGSLNVYLGMKNSEGIGMLVQAAEGGAGVTNVAQVAAETRRQRIWMVEHEREEDFVGRADVMKDIQARFDGGSRRVAMVGIGGVG